MRRYDLEKEERDRLVKAEKAHHDAVVQNELRAIREALFAQNALLAGILMRGRR